MASDKLIRAAQPSDREPLLRLAADIFTADEIPVASELIEAAAAGSRDYQALLADHRPAGIAGYICYGPTPMTAATYDLYWIGCHPSVRGRGLAGALVAAMESDLRARGATAVRVRHSPRQIARCRSPRPHRRRWLQH